MPHLEHVNKKSLVTVNILDILAVTSDEMKISKSVKLGSFSGTGGRAEGSGVGVSNPAKYDFQNASSTNS